MSFDIMANFKITSTYGNARHGILRTQHGDIETPVFMPVATKGSVKLLSNEEVESTGTRCMISNAFILSLKPGLEAIEKHNGLHGFMNWKHGLFTDSGGFQVLSPEFCLKLSDEGVIFRNPFDGKRMLFTPEQAVEIQNRMGSDVAMCLDDVPLHGSDAKRLAESAERTTLWAERCKDAHANPKQMLFGICQGGINKKLREKSTRQIVALGFDGVALGGLCIGESKQKMFEAAKLALGLIPEEKPRYLMGVGSAQELVEAVALGIDIFDSCFPTRTARHGTAFSSSGNVNIDSPRYSSDTKPVDSACKCYVCQNHSKAYLHHLFKTKEENALKYLSYHNLFFIQNLMNEMRTAIKEGSFSAGKFSLGKK